MAETGQPYAYTGDNPVNDRDPMGLKGEWYDDPQLPENLRGVEGKSLRNLINNEYRGKPLRGIREGDGGTADMLRSEINNPNWDGNLESLGHYAKALQDQTRLGKIISNPEAYGSPDSDLPAAKLLKANLNAAAMTAKELSESSSAFEVHQQQVVLSNELGTAGVETELASEGSTAFKFTGSGVPEDGPGSVGEGGGETVPGD